jgi:hypothetical protein
MSGDNKNTRLYTARDIQKYLEGELSAPEMYALEKAALEDPFLADALDGIEDNRLRHGEISFQNGLDELNRKLENKIIEKKERRKSILLRSRWQVAAAFILLSGLAAVTYRYLFSEKSRPALAKSESPVVVADSTASVSAVPANPGKTKSQADQAKHPVPATHQTSDKLPNTAKEKFFKPSLSSPLAADNSERQSKQQIQAKPVQQEAETLSFMSQENSILSKDSLSPSKAPAVVTNSLLGKVAGVAARKPQTDTLDEVTTGSVGSSQSDSMAIRDQPAAPAGGWQEYESWLEKNRKLGTANSTLKGKETISFRVNKKGELSSFKIEHSLSPAHDTEAIRLIKEGPGWKLFKGRKARVTVTVSF